MLHFSSTSSMHASGKVDIKVLSDRAYITTRSSRSPPTVIFDISDFDVERVMFIAEPNQKQRLSWIYPALAPSPPPQKRH